MVQLSYDNPSSRAGTVQNRIRTMSLRNTRTAQVVNWDINGGVTDGTYTIECYDPTGVYLLATASYVASSKTAAQIAAGVVAAILASSTWRGLITACAVVNTDQLDITFGLNANDLDYVVRKTSATPAGPTDPTTSTSAGLTRVAVGIILQSDTSGGWTTTYTDAAIAYGVTFYQGPSMQPEDLSLAPSIGDADFAVLACGSIDVAIASGVTVDKGDKAYFNPSAKTWSNASSGSHVLVEGALWQTTGTTVQTVYVNLPSET
jgi:hypothetical protein